MPAFSGTFSGSVELQSAIAVADKPNHQLSIAEVRGPQTSPDAKLDNAVITYSALIDVADGTGTQRGYFVNVHADGDSDFGAFEGTISPLNQEELGCDGTWEFIGGTGQYKEITGKGKFTMRISSKSVSTSWDGVYELAEAIAEAAALS